jgi:hypothetical protein
MSIFLSVLKAIGDPVLDDVGPQRSTTGPDSCGTLAFLHSLHVNFLKEVDDLHNLGDLVSADLGNCVLELVEDLDPEGPCVGGKSGLGVSVVLAAFSTWVFVSVSTSTFLEKLIVGTDLSKFVSQTCWWSQS